MQQETKTTLDTAVKAFREAPLNPVKAMAAESEILNRWKQPSGQRVTWMVGLGATALAGALAFGMMLTPSRSVAAELVRIAQNGDTGMRHVVQHSQKPDGTEEEVEYYANGDRARMIVNGSQLIFGKFSGKPGPERLIILSSDGSATIQDAKADQLYRWTEFSAAQILKKNGPMAKVSLRHDARQDIYEMDTNEGRPLHTVIYVDSKTERPVKEVVTGTGWPTLTTEWDYPAYDAALLSGPAIDPHRLYDLDLERKSISSAMETAGSVVTAAGEKVELKQLWIDEAGDVAAITMSDFPHPDNFSLRVDGVKIGTEPEDPETTNHYLVHKSNRYQGSPMMVLFSYRHGTPLTAKFGDVVSLDIPVSHGNVVAGYAHFDGVKVNRCQNVGYLISPMNLPFFADPEPEVKASATKPA